MSDILGFILFIVSAILKIAISPFIYLFGFYMAARKKELGDYHKQIALSTDRFGNVLGQYAFNKLLILNNGYKAGNGKESISSFIGKNKVFGTLSWLGNRIAYILNKLEKSHVEKAIDDNV